MNFKSFIARRYLSTKNKPLFIMLLTWISIVGMSVSVFALIFVLAIMAGFEKDFHKRIIGMKSPLTVMGGSGEDWDGLVSEMRRREPRVTAAIPFVEGEAILQTGEGTAAGVRVRAIKGVLDLKRLQELSSTDPLQEGEVWIGRELSYSLAIDPDFEDEVRLLFPLGDIGPTGEILPRTRSVLVTGLFRSGFYEYDSKYLLATYEEATRLFGEYGRYGLEVWLDNIRDSEQVRQSLLSWVDPGKFTLLSWEEQNPKLFAALKLEKIGMTLLLSVLLVIAACTIFGLISLTIIEKMRDVAILHALGLNRRRLQAIFLTKAILIGLLGSFLGGGLAIATITLLHKYPLRLPTTYYVEYLPLQMNLPVVVLILLAAPLVALLTSFYPSQQIRRYSLEELLRYE
ncbi:MAG: ABC transporter permease [Deltaproteobacteria bacterium]|nr:ABC transporter permease [Deltaproteobacteria bacterium]